MRRTVRWALLVAVLGVAPGCAVTPIQLPGSEDGPANSQPGKDKGASKGADGVGDHTDGLVPALVIDAELPGAGDGSRDFRPCDSGPAGEGGPPDGGTGLLDQGKPLLDAGRAGTKDLR